MTTKNIALVAAVLLACGGSGGSNPGGNANPDAGLPGDPDAGTPDAGSPGATGCTVALTGDAAANFTPVTLSCGYPLTASVAGTTVGPVVRAVGTHPAIGGGTANTTFILIQSPTTGLSGTSSFHSLVMVPGDTTTLPTDWSEAFVSLSLCSSKTRGG
jgi:hypothetical protein